MNPAASLDNLPMLLAGLDRSTDFNTARLRKDLITAGTLQHADLGHSILRMKWIYNVLLVTNLQDNFYKQKERHRRRSLM
jgi:hypothetical protein